MAEATRPMSLSPKSRIVAGLAMAVAFAGAERAFGRDGAWDVRMVGSLIAFFVTVFALNGQLGFISRLARVPRPPARPGSATFEAACGLLAGLAAALCHGSAPIAVVIGGTSWCLAAIGSALEAEGATRTEAMASERDMASSYAISAIAEEIRSASAKGDGAAVEAAADRAQAYAESLISGDPALRPKEDPRT